MHRRTVSSNTEWEEQVGYSRATRVGNVVHVAGTTATDDGTPIDGGPYEQTVHILDQIEETLKEASASIEDVTRTRMFVTVIDNWEEIGRAHEAVFGEIRPAASMVQVQRLIDPRLCVEIEADAVVEES